MGEVTIYPKSL